MHGKSTLHSPHQIQLEKENLPSNRPPPPLGQKAAGDNFIKTFWAFEFGGTVLLKLIWVSQLHREQAVTGRIFQALPTQTDTTVALIYKIHEQGKKVRPYILVPFILLKVIGLVNQQASAFYQIALLVVNYYLPNKHLQTTLTIP